MKNLDLKTLGVQELTCNEASTIQGMNLSWSIIGTVNAPYLRRESTPEEEEWLKKAFKATSRQYGSPF